MTPIKNSSWNLKPLAEPTLCIGIALLAGYTRLIEYFPGSTKGGLLVTAALASTNSTLYDRKVYHPDHGTLKTLLGKTATIALTTIASVYLTKPLNAKGISLSLNGGAKLGVIQCLLAAIFTYTRQETPLQQQHRHFGEHYQTWRDLTVEGRIEWVQKFYEADLPAISLLNLVDLDRDGEKLLQFLPDFEKVLDNLEQYSAAELSWIRELKMMKSCLRSLKHNCLMPTTLITLVFLTLLQEINKL